MISLIIPTTSKTKTYTKNVIRNIRELYPDIEIIVEENDSVTLGQNYNNAVAKASGDKIILLHNDMVLSPGFVETMDKHIQPGRITTYTRIEPPIYNDVYPGKVILDCGSDLETFNETVFNSYQTNFDLIEGGSQLFFGCMRDEYIGIDGDTFAMFCEDDDLHRRYRLLGFEHKVSSAHVYHFVSKTSRTTQNYQQIELASNRNYIRKWGTKTEAPKYNIGIQVTNCTLPILELLEPYCDRIYIDDEMQVITSHYLDSEQSKTKFDLTKRVMTIGYNNPYDYDDIVVEVDAKRMTQQEAAYIFMLPDIIQESGELGSFRLGNLKITIQHLETYENTLLYLEK
jgi:GT2 family glycosyltransferase